MNYSFIIFMLELHESFLFFILFDHLVLFFLKQLIFIEIFAVRILLLCFQLCDFIISNFHFLFDLRFLFHSLFVELPFQLLDFLFLFIVRFPGD